MGSGLRIGRLFGIDVRVDASWLFVALLVTTNLSSVFGRVHPSWAPGLRWGLAILAALLFFGSVLAHELAHSLVARARGIPVRSITLFLFGGVSSIQREPASPGSEFLMAVVGPLTSLILGGVLLWLGAAAIIAPMIALSNPVRAIARSNPVSTVFLWLGWVNLSLGVFNLVPGFPLDGGRVLRSALWALLGNLRRATQWASLVGQGVAWIMVSMGLAMIFGARILFFGSGLVSGLWLIFIGWFLHSAAVQSYRQVLINDILGDVAVGRLMRTNPPTCRPECTVNNLVHEHVMGTDDQAFPVLADGQLVGLVTLDDVRKVPPAAWAMTTVAEIMTPAERLVVATPEEDAAAALGKLAERDVRQLPVVQGGQLVGLLRRQDIVRWLQLTSQSGAMGGFR